MIITMIQEIIKKMIINRIMKILVLILSACVSTQVYADDLAEVMNVLQEMYTVENTNLPASLQQLKTVDSALNTNLSGNFGYGNYLNGTSDLNQKLWSNNNWSDVLDNIGGGNAQQFSLAQQAYANTYPVVSSNQIGQTLNNNDLTRVQYQQASNVDRAALAGSSYSYDQINTHIQDIHTILAMLENQPSEKAAVDLNTRLVAEVSFIQLEMLKQQDIQTQLMATQSQNSVNGLSDESKFNQWNPPQ